MCMMVLMGVRNILWPKKPPKGGEIIKKRLTAFLNNQALFAPQRGRGAYLGNFIRHVRKVTTSYWPGLFHCYDDPRIPQTSNAIEQLFGKGKRALRACGGRMSTAVGPGSSGGSFFLFSVALHATTDRGEREELLKRVSYESYRTSRAKQGIIRGPETRRRRFVRNPEMVLARIGEKWDRTQV